MDTVSDGWLTLYLAVIPITAVIIIGVIAAFIAITCLICALIAIFARTALNIFTDEKEID